MLNNLLLLLLEIEILTQVAVDFFYYLTYLNTQLIIIFFFFRGDQKQS